MKPLLATLVGARSSFRRSTLWHFASARTFWYSLNGHAGLKNLFNGRFWSCCQFLFIGTKMVTIDANPMPLVHSILYQRCTGGIGFASIVTVLSPTKTQDYTHVFGPLRTICTTAYIKFEPKNLLTDRHLFINWAILNHLLKLEHAVCSWSVDMPQLCWACTSNI